MKRIAIPVLAAVLALTAGCNGSSPTGPGGPVGTATFSATVDGVAWTADVVSAVRQGGAVVVTGADATPFSVQISFLEGSGSPIALSDSTPANGLVNDNLVFWATAAPGGTGSIEVTELTASGVKGTFSFTTGVNNAETPEVRVVTGGVFEVEF